MHIATSGTPRAPRRLTVLALAGLLAGLVALPATAAPSGPAAPAAEQAVTASERPPIGPERPRPGHRHDTLRAAAPRGFAIGTAVAGGGHHVDQPVPDPFNTDLEYRSLIGREFNSVTPENHLKWEMVQPEQGVFDFAPADQVIEYARWNRQDVRGHALAWHSQNPDWLEEGDFTPDELRAILKDHITTVVSRYRGRIDQWDVANEIFLDNGSWRSSVWYDALGPDFVADAFRWAHEADPDALLFLNDYNVEGINAKSNAYYQLVQDLLADGVPVHGFGIQGHLSTQFGFPGQVQANLERFDALGLRTAFTEVDVRIPLPASGVPTDAQLARQASDFGRLLQACLNVRGCDSFTVWGFLDTYSWVPVFFQGQGAANLMFEDFTRKPAYYEIKRLLEQAPPQGPSPRPVGRG